MVMLIGGGGGGSGGNSSLRSVSPTDVNDDRRRDMMVIGDRMASCKEENKLNRNANIRIANFRKRTLSGSHASQSATCLSLFLISSNLRPAVSSASLHLSDILVKTEASSNPTCQFGC